MRALRLLVIACAACPPSTQEVDAPASSLDLVLSVVDTTATPSDGKVAVLAQFSKDGPTADLGAAAKVTCNGVALTFGGVGYEGRVPLVPPGGSYGFVHLRAGTSTTATVIAPPRPVVLSPGAGSAVTRTRSLTIHYQAGAGSSVRATASAGMTAVGGSDQPDSGSYTGLDVTSLRAGAGTVGIVRDLPATLSGTGFRSAEVTFTVASEDVAVSWN
jgi:hypothetical protein